MCAGNCKGAWVLDSAVVFPLCDENLPRWAEVHRLTMMQSGGGGGGWGTHPLGYILTPVLLVGMCHGKVKNGQGLRNELPVERENVRLWNELEPF